MEQSLLHDWLENGMERMARKLIPHVTKLAINSFSCVNAPSQFAGIAALDGPDDSIPT